MSQTSGTADCYEDQQLVKKEMIHNGRLSRWQNSIKLITGHLNLECEGNDNKTVSNPLCVCADTIICLDSEYLACATVVGYPAQQICDRLASHHLVMRNRKQKFVNTSILAIAVNIKPENLTYMLIKFFLIWNHMMNVVVVMFMRLFCYRTLQRWVGNIVKQSINMILQPSQLYRTYSLHVSCKQGPQMETGDLLTVLHIFVSVFQLKKF